MTKYVVTYRAGLKLKDKFFDTLEEAREFANRRKRNGVAYVIAKVDKVSRLENLLNAKLKWRGGIELHAWLVLAATAGVAVTGYLLLHRGTR